jgi:hypothetical protein
MPARQAIVTTSWDDGDPKDGRLAELLCEFDIQGTFAERFEVGAHTVTHPELTALDGAELEREIGQSKSMLQDVLGKEVPMFCYPRGLHNRQVRRAVMEAGFRGARTTAQFRVRVDSDPWRLPVTLQAFPHSLGVRVRHGLRSRNFRGLGNLFRLGARRSWVDLACAFFERVVHAGGVWHLWGHSWEIDRYGVWSDLRTVLARVARRPGVRYLTNGQLVADLEAAGGRQGGL